MIDLTAGGNKDGPSGAMRGYIGAGVNLVSSQLIAISCRGSAQWSTQLQGSFVCYSGWGFLLDALSRISEMLVAPC